MTGHARVRIFVYFRENTRDGGGYEGRNRIQQKALRESSNSNQRLWPARTRESLYRSVLNHTRRRLRVGDGGVPRRARSVQQNAKG